jgi:hypothetical protein
VQKREGKEKRFYMTYKDLDNHDITTPCGLCPGIVPGIATFRRTSMLNRPRNVAAAFAASRERWRNHWPEVTANRSGEEPFRIERLLQLSGFLRARLRPDEFYVVAALHDHKGDLTVTLVINPSWHGSEHIEREVKAGWEEFNEYVVEFRYVIRDEDA